MKPYLFNNSNIVSQAIDGNLNVSCSKLARVSAEHFNVVVRSDYEENKDKTVAIISGGGSAHEPLHTGFVGRGMLTAAVCGEIFASPSINAILSAILLVTGEKGCLLIVKNYAGDRLNFAIAAERAKTMGRDVEILVVSDDIAIPNLEKRRGIAGTLLIHKIAGHFAEQGFSLTEIKNKCEKATEGLFSLGLSMFAADSLSGSELIEYDPQVGRGIHNEAGKPFSFNSQDMAKEAVTMVLDNLVAKINDSSLYAILINNLGGLTPLEMSVITNEILSSPFKDRIKYAIPGRFCTSLNMRGFSLSLLALTDEIEQALLAEVEPQAWVQPVIPVQPKLIDVTYLDLRHEYIPSENEQHRKIIDRICDVVISSKDKLNELDGKSGDEDAGTTFCSIGTHIQTELDNLPLENLAHLFLAIGQLLESVGGGTSGVLLSLLFSHTGNALERGLNLAPALKEGVETMAKYAGSRPGDRSLLDALIPAIEALEENADIQIAALAARKGANATSSMIAKVGRAANVDPRFYREFNDSGAEATAIIFECLAETEE